jgi:hypothetical protein
MSGSNNRSAKWRRNEEKIGNGRAAIYLSENVSRAWLMAKA